MSPNSITDSITDRITVTMQQLTWRICCILRSLRPINGINNNNNNSSSSSKVVYRCSSGVVGYLIITLLQIVHGMCKWKNCLKSVNNWRSDGQKLGDILFLTHGVCYNDANIHGEQPAVAISSLMICRSTVNSSTFSFNCSFSWVSVSHWETTTSASLRQLYTVFQKKRSHQTFGSNFVKS